MTVSFSIFRKILTKIQFQFLEVSPNFLSQPLFYSYMTVIARSQLVESCNFNMLRITSYPSSTKIFSLKGKPLQFKNKKYQSNICCTKGIELRKVVKFDNECRICEVSAGDISYISSCLRMSSWLSTAERRCFG